MAFKVPLQSEVQAYIQEKKGWPEKFCKYYAERFWNFYQSNGWRVSGKAAMKDWKAAFNSQWQTLKFKEDIDFLNACLKSEQGQTRLAGQASAETGGSDKTVMYMDELLAYYEKNWDKVEEARLASCYDWLKEQRLMRITKEEGQMAQQACGGDIRKGKAICVKILFDKMITRGQTFKQLTAHAVNQ